MPDIIIVIWKQHNHVFKFLQDALKRLRVDDDKIQYQLNAIIPTQSFAQKVNTTEQCKALYEKVIGISRVFFP